MLKQKKGFAKKATYENITLLGLVAAACILVIFVTWTPSYAGWMGTKELQERCRAEMTANAQVRHRDISPMGIRAGQGKTDERWAIDCPSLPPLTIKLKDVESATKSDTAMKYYIMRIIADEMVSCGKTYIADIRQAVPFGAVAGRYCGVCREISFDEPLKKEFGVDFGKLPNICNYEGKCESPKGKKLDIPAKCSSNDQCNPTCDTSKNKCKGHDGKYLTEPSKCTSDTECIGSSNVINNFATFLQNQKVPGSNFYYSELLYGYRKQSDEREDFTDTMMKFYGDAPGLDSDIKIDGQSIKNSTSAVLKDNFQKADMTIDPAKDYYIVHYILKGKNFQKEYSEGLAKVVDRQNQQIEDYCSTSALLMGGGGIISLIPVIGDIIAVVPEVIGAGLAYSCANTATDIATNFVLYDEGKASLLPPQPMFRFTILVPNLSKLKCDHTYGLSNAEIK